MSLDKSLDDLGATIHEILDAKDDRIAELKDAAAALRARAEQAEAERDQLRAALIRLHNPASCGDHCSSVCPQCQATAALARMKEEHDA